MKAVNLYFLTREHGQYGVSGLLNALSRRKKRKEVSLHEASSLWHLADRLSLCLSSRRPSQDWLIYLDGFFFSYVIEHIGKEFDLLKISSDGGTVLNIELKSEKVDEEKIRKQLEQNRYYLSHSAHMIYSFTYVMETDEVYVLDADGHLNLSCMDELVDILMCGGLQNYLNEGIENYFKAADYLISPVADPGKFLDGKYFLTNQQFDFRKRIRSCLAEQDRNSDSPVITISGNAGTGKTLLLFDLARELSGTHRVLFIHSGPLRKGHLELDKRLGGIDIISGKGAIAGCRIRGYGYVMIDEADHLKKPVLDSVFASVKPLHIPVILTYDPHRLLLKDQESGSGTENVSDVLQSIEERRTLSFEFTGNIRINRPVYSFLRELLNPREHAVNMGYDCVDVLYANDRTEQNRIAGYYRKHGYVLVSLSGRAERESDVIAREYDKVIMILDETYYYDDTMHLRVREKEEAALRLLYEGLSRTRERLCLLVTGNSPLFMRILAIRNKGEMK